MVKKSDARSRVREARARLDADRHAREQRVDAAAEEFFRGTEAVESAGAKLAKAQQAHDDAVAAAQVAQDAAVVAMLEQDEKAEIVAELLGVSRAEVTAAKKRHTDREQPPAAEQGPGADSASPRDHDDTSNQAPAVTEGAA